MKMNLHDFPPFRAHAHLYTKNQFKKTQFCSILRAQTQCQARVHPGLGTESIPSLG